MMNKMNKKRIGNLAISVMVAIVGAIVLWLSYKLIDFRVFGGGYSIPASKLLMVVKAMGIMVLEWGAGLVGLCLLLLGTIGTYNNAKKMMR